MTRIGADVEKRFRGFADLPAISIEATLRPVYGEPRLTEAIPENVLAELALFIVVASLERCGSLDVTADFDALLVTAPTNLPGWDAVFTARGP